MAASFPERASPNGSPYSHISMKETSPTRGGAGPHAAGATASVQERGIGGTISDTAIHVMPMLRALGTSEMERIAMKRTMMCG